MRPLLAALWLLVCLQARAESVHLEGVDARLVSCSPASTVPCFRLRLRVANEQGDQAAIAAPPPEQLARTITVTVVDRHITPFFARVSTAQTQLAQKSRTTLILVDVSGSMNARLKGETQTRFQAAQAALQEFLRGFELGEDRVAIVPFESHDVAGRIRSAPFVETIEEAHQLINDLPYPSSRNNTALYAAVEIGVDVLARQRQIHPQDEQLLLILTDGRNDVRSGDDPDLLRNPVHLDDVVQKLQSFRGQILAIGLGNRHEIDEQALRRMSPQHVELAEDARTLTGLFSSARRLLSSQLQVSFASPFPDLASLAGRSLDMNVTWTLPGERYAQTDRPVHWAAGDMGVTYEGECEPDEQAAVPRQWHWISVVRPALVFVGIGALLLILWIWVPRFIWPPTVPTDLRPVRSDQPQSPRRPSKPAVHGSDERTNVQASDAAFRTRLRDDRE